MGVTFVKNQDDKVVGLITDGDRELLINQIIFDMTAQDFMSKGFISYFS